MNGKVRFEGEVAGCLYQIEPYYYVYYIYALHLPPQTSRFTILKILFRENRKHVVLYIWYYILYCIIYIVIGYRYFKFLKKTPKQKITKWSFQFMISFDLLALFAQGSYNQEDLLCS